MALFLIPKGKQKKGWPKVTWWHTMDKKQQKKKNYDTWIKMLVMGKFGI